MAAYCLFEGRAGEEFTLILLLQETQVWFPAPTSAGDLTSFSNLPGHCTHVYTHTHTINKNKSYLRGKGPKTQHRLAHLASFIVPSPLPPQITKISAGSPTVRKWEAPPLTVVPPQEQMGLALCGAEEAAAEPGPHLLPRAPCSSIPQPYPPGCRHEGTQAPGL